MNKEIYNNYVVQVVRFKSLTKTAAAMGISQPALSAGLTALEKELGFKVFYRKKAPIALTPEGEIYYEYLKKAKELSNDYQRRVDACRKSGESCASIGGPVAYIESIVTKAVERLLREGKNYHIAIKCSPLYDLIEQASDGELDCFISTSANLPDNFVTKQVKKERIYLCVPAKDPINELLKEAVTERQKTELLQGKEFIFLEKTQPLQRMVQSFFEKNGIVPTNHIIVNQISTALNLATKGSGMCFVSEDALKAGVDLGGVGIYDLPASFFNRTVYIAYEKDAYLTQACRELMECIAEKKIKTQESANKKSSPK